MQSEFSTWNFTHKFDFAGQYAGAFGSKMNFGYKVKFNKCGKNLQGQANIIMRSGGRTYQIKDNAVDSLAVQSHVSPKSATLVTKVNLIDITDSGRAEQRRSCTVSEIT